MINPSFRNTLSFSGGYRKINPKKKDFVYKKRSRSDVVDDVSDYDDDETIEKKIPKKKARPKVKVGRSGKKDIVEELRLSDIE